MKRQPYRGPSPTPTAFSGFSGLSISLTAVPTTDYRQISKIHYAELGRYLANYLASAAPKSRLKARPTLTRLTIQQFHELSTDVYDVMLHRRDEEEVPFLPLQEQVNAQRNQARRKMAALPTTRFEDLSCDVYFELERRYPEFNEDPSGRNASNYDDYPAPDPPSNSAPRNSGVISASGSTLADRDRPSDSGFGGSVSSQRRALESQIQCLKEEELEASKKWEGVQEVDLKKKEEQTRKPQDVLRISDVEKTRKHPPYAILVTTRKSADSLSSISLSSAAPEDLTGFIVREGEYPAHGGGYADVYKGVLRHDEKDIKVAIKVIRAHTYTPVNQWKIDKRLRREIRLWSCLRHPNIVPLLGTTLGFGSYTAMVCPWMNDGNLNHYLNNRKPELNLYKRLQILRDVVEGLSYLHSQPIIHGDLTTGNILMDGGTAHLSDFGLSNLMPEVRDNSFMTSTVGGAPRWTAPELLHCSTDITVVPDATKHSDIYSFGSVALQVISGRIPYEDIVSDVQVLMVLIKGTIPPRPHEPLLSDEFWEFIVLCWNKDPVARPEIEKLREKLQLLRSCCSEEVLSRNVIDANKIPDKEVPSQSFSSPSASPNT